MKYQYLQLRNRKKKRTPKMEREKLHGKFKREKEEVRSQETWGWIRKGYLKKEKEEFIFAAQEQDLKPN